jgi:hypothetical protein
MRRVARADTAECPCFSAAAPKVSGNSGRLYRDSNEGGHVVGGHNLLVAGTC